MPEARNSAVSDQTTFNPYHKWLGIPPAEQPPHHYRLLGIDVFESDSDVILSAVDQRVSYLRQCALGPNGDASQKLLNEVSNAQVCLLDQQKKAAYDDQLRAKLQAASAGADRVAGQAEGSAKPSRNRSAKGSGAAGSLAEQKAKVQQLVAAHQYAAAVKTLEKLASVKDPAAAKYAQWAQKQLPLIKARPKKLKEESAAAVRLAKGMLQKHEYGPAAELLQQVPERFRSDEAQRLIERAIDLQEEVDLLVADMDDAIERNEYEGLQPNIERLLELKPGHRRARELYDELSRYGGAGLAVRRNNGPPIVTGGKAAGLPWGVVAGIFVAAFSLTTLAVVFYLKSNGKTIRIEIDDPTAQVMVDGDVITITGNAGAVKLEPGQHELKVTRGDTVVQTRNFEVHKEKNPILKITLLDSDEDPTDVASNTPSDPVPEDPPTTEPEPEDPPAAPGVAGIAGVVIPDHTLGFGVLTMGETFRDPKKTISQMDAGLAGLPFAKPDVGSGELTFNVTSDTNVRLAMIDDWGKGGNSSGGWLERVIPREDFLAAGWKPIGAIRTGDGSTKYTVFERASKAGETFTYRNHKYVAPILIGTQPAAAPQNTAGSGAVPTGFEPGLIARIHASQPFRDETHLVTVMEDAHEYFGYFTPKAVNTSIDDWIVEAARAELEKYYEKPDVQIVTTGYIVLEEDTTVQGIFRNSRCEVDGQEVIRTGSTITKNLDIPLTKGVHTFKLWRSDHGQAGPSFSVRNPNTTKSVLFYRPEDLQAELQRKIDVNGTELQSTLLRKNAPAAPAPTGAVDLSSVPAVAARLESKRGATNALPTALVFDAPRGDGRSGASGLLLEPPTDWDSRGTVWSCQFSRNGSSRGVIFIHPHGDGQVIVSVRQNGLHLASPDQWPGPKPYEPGRSVIPLTLSADFKDVFQLGDQTRELVSRLQPDGTYEFLLDGKVVASATISDVKPLNFGAGVNFKDSTMPEPIRGYGGVIIGPTDGGSAKASQIRFGAIPAG